MSDKNRGSQSTVDVSAAKAAAAAAEAAAAAAAKAAAAAAANTPSAPEPSAPEPNAPEPSAPEPSAPEPSAPESESAEARFRREREERSARIDALAEPLRGASFTDGFNALCRAHGTNRVNATKSILSSLSPFDRQSVTLQIVKSDDGKIIDVIIPGLLEPLRMRAVEDNTGKPPYWTAEYESLAYYADGSRAPSKPYRPKAGDIRQSWNEAAEFALVTARTHILNSIECRTRMPAVAAAEAAAESAAKRQSAAAVTAAAVAETVAAALAAAGIGGGGSAAAEAAAARAAQEETNRRMLETLSALQAKLDALESSK